MFLVQMSHKVPFDLAGHRAAVMLFLFYCVWSSYMKFFSAGKHHFLLQTHILKYDTIASCVPQKVPFDPTGQVCQRVYLVT